MPCAIVTGSGGLIGSESVRHLVADGFDVIGIENDMRAHFFGPEASTAGTTERLLKEHAGAFTSVDLDIRDADGVTRIVREHVRDLELIVHTAAQPSHDWAASDALTDFGVNALGTLHLLEAARHHRPEATFIFTSTNKVYGDRPNRLRSWRATRGWSCPRTTTTTRASRPRCRWTAACTRSSAPPRSPPTSWCRSTGATSTCRPCASVAAA